MAGTATAPAEQMGGESGTDTAELARQEKGCFSFPKSPTPFTPLCNVNELKLRRGERKKGNGLWLRELTVASAWCVSPVLRSVQCTNDGRSCWCVDTDGREVPGSRQPGWPTACEWEGGSLCLGRSQSGLLYLPL